MSAVQYMCRVEFENCLVPEGKGFPVETLPCALVSLPLHCWRLSKPGWPPKVKETAFYYYKTQPMLKMLERNTAIVKYSYQRSGSSPMHA